MRTVTPVFLSILLLAGCATLRAPQPEHLNPRPVSVEMTVTVRIGDVLEGDALRAENERLGIPAGTPPTLMIWSAIPESTLGQDISLTEVSPEPTSTSRDPENGNTILLWNLTGQFHSGETITIRRVHSGTLWGWDLSLSSSEIAGTHAPGREYERYTASEPFLELTPAIRQCAEEIAGDTANSWERARLIFRFVRSHMTYEYPPPSGRGASAALREGRGDCGQFADLFIALCRSVGVPARFAGGFMLLPQDDGSTEVGPHAWAEVMLPGGRWVPVDPTGDEEHHFGRCLANDHLRASVGRNIPLPGAPDWARCAFSDVENGRTEFMQTFTEVHTGVVAEAEAHRRLLP